MHETHEQLLKMHGNSMELLQNIFIEDFNCPQNMRE